MRNETFDTGIFLNDGKARNHCGYINSMTLNEAIFIYLCSNIPDLDLHNTFDEDYKLYKEMN